MTDNALTCPEDDICTLDNVTDRTRWRLRMMMWENYVRKESDRVSTRETKKRNEKDKAEKYMQRRLIN